MQSLKRRLVYLILLSGLLILILVGLGVKYQVVLRLYQDYCSSYEVWGVVTDYGSDLPVEGAKINSSKNYTFTDWEGKFFLTRLRENETTSLQLPEGYEPYQTLPVNYQDYGQRLLCQRIIKTNYHPLPGARLVLQRLLEEEAHRNFDYLWSFMAQEGQALWVSKTATNKVMSQQSLILDKLGLVTVSFEILPDEKTEELASWSYPLTGRQYNDVRQYQVIKQRSNGEKITESWFLIKENGYWHYFPSESKGLVDAFISKNWSVWRPKGKL